MPTFFSPHEAAFAHYLPVAEEGRRIAVPPEELGFAKEFPGEVVPVFINKRGFPDHRDPAVMADYREAEVAREHGDIAGLINASVSACRRAFTWWKAPVRLATGYATARGDFMGAAEQVLSAAKAGILAQMAGGMPDEMIAATVAPVTRAHLEEVLREVAFNLAHYWSAVGNPEAAAGEIDEILPIVAADQRAEFLLQKACAHLRNGQPRPAMDALRLAEEQDSNGLEEWYPAFLLECPQLSTLRANRL